MKIRLKIFFIMLLVILVISGGFAVTNSLYLKKFYIANKKEKLIKVGNTILDSSRIVDLRNLELQNNAEILIRKRDYLEKYYLRRIITLDDLIDITRALDNNAYIFKTIYFNDYHGKAVVLFLPYKTDRYVEIISPLNLIKEGIEISLHYHSQIILFAFILGLIAAFFLSKAIVAPILELKDMARNISNLDFSHQFRKPRNDEIGELGLAFNQMGRQLKETLDKINNTNLQLTKDIEEKQEMDKLRKEFVAYVSHELKTPIAIIQGYAQGLLENVNTQEDREFYCDVIIDETRKMNALVRELLLMSKIEAGYFQMGNSAADIYELISDITENHLFQEDPEAEKPNIIYKGPTFVTAYCDENYIEKVFDNFIGNAVKYRVPNSDIIIETKDLGNKYRFIISNECNNLTTKDLESIWTPFIRLETSIGKEGHGLGLALIAGILKRHNSKFGVHISEKEDKKFVNFWFELSKVNESIEYNSTGEDYDKE